MGSGGEVAEAVVARRAFGSGYWVVPSVGIFGLKMRFLDRVSMWCVEWGGLGFAVGEFGDAGAGVGEEVVGVSLEEFRFGPGEVLKSGWVGNGEGAREVFVWACGKLWDWACCDVMDWAGAILLLWSP